jgi:hypothetical protein
MLCKVVPSDTRLALVTVVRLREVQARLRKTLAASTCNDILSKLCRPLLRHAVEMGWLATNPAKELKPLKEARASAHTAHVGGSPPDRR